MPASRCWPCCRPPIGASVLRAGAGLATLALGQTVTRHLRQLPAGSAARISFISSEAEFTPPVIFSQEERAKLVFRVEAQPARRRRAAARPAGHRHAAGAKPRRSRPPTEPWRTGRDRHRRRGLTKSFGGRAVVQDLTMQVRRGLIYGFLGPNGSGKTTTIRMLCGLLDAGQRARHLPRLRHPHAIGRDQAHVGYMTQRFSLYADLSIRENLEFVARVYGLPRAARGPRAPRSSGSASTTAPSSSPASSRAAGSSAWRSAPASCPARSSSSSTSRPPASIRRRGATSGTRSTRSPHEGMTVLVSTHYMDEAERCHEIAYIAYGELLAQGHRRGGGRQCASRHLHGDRPGARRPRRR